MSQHDCPRCISGCASNNYNGYADPGAFGYCGCACHHYEPFGVLRDTDGTILRGPSLLCGCPLDSDCTGYHGGA
jgi:hypothetical protein